MKQFLLFAGEDYYRKGGILDLRDAFDTIEAAVLAARALKVETSRYFDWWHIVDVSDGQVISCYNSQKMTISEFKEF